MTVTTGWNVHPRYRPDIFMTDAEQVAHQESEDRKEIFGDKKFIPSMMQMRKWNLAEGDEPSFFCPACHDRFKVSYGVFGNIPLDRNYHENQFWCRDCASLNNISKNRR